MNSIFSNIYKYRQRENRNAKENFLTEIFAFCIENDNLFFNHFLQKLGIPFNDESYSVQTQVPYKEGIPDIEIKWNNINHLLIEAKVAQGEGTHQLKRYTQILDNSKLKNKYLVYLTRDYENKTIETDWLSEDWELKEHELIQRFEKKNTSFSFHHLRWTDIFNLITTESKEITIQLKKYLKEENMYTSNFNFHSITSLQEIGSTFSKIDRILDDVAPYFEEQIGKSAKCTQTAHRLSNGNCYRDFVWFNKKFAINYGIGWFLEGEVFVYLDFYMIDYVEKDKLAKTIKSNIKNTDFLFKNDYDLSVGFKKPLASFFDEADHHNAIIKYLKECIDDVKEFKNSHIDIFE